MPPPRRAPSVSALISGQEESSNSSSLARGAMLCVVLYSGIALGAAGTSTSFASMTFHFAPKAVAPATVIRSTLCEGGSEGGMIGGGDGTGCANEPKAKIMKRPSSAQAASMAGYFRRISLLPWMIKQVRLWRSLTPIAGHRRLLRTPRAATPPGSRQVRPGDVRHFADIRRVSCPRSGSGGMVGLSPRQETPVLPSSSEATRKSGSTFVDALR